MALGSALTVTGSDLIYACVGNPTSGPTISSATGYNIRYNVENNGSGSNGIGVIDALNVTSNNTPACTMSGTVTNWCFNGVAFKAPTGTVWVHQQGGGVQATSTTQASVAITFSSQVTAGDLIVVTMASAYASGMTASVSDGTHTYSVAVADPTSYTATNQTTFYLVAPFNGVV